VIDPPEPISQEDAEKVESSPARELVHEAAVEILKQQRSWNE